jgi:heme exporter protein C
MDADQGFMQKIFYVHVPLAIVALCGFVLGGIMAIQHLRTATAATTCAATSRSTCR